VSLVEDILGLLSLFQLSNAGVHALRHILVLCVLGLGNVEKLKSELANAIRRASDHTTTLALDAACAGVVDSPFIETRDVDVERSAVRLILMVVEANIRASEGAVGSDQVVE